MNRLLAPCALVSALLLSSCVAETIERRRPRKGPIKAVGFVDFGGGKMRYSVEGWPWFVAGRRRDALRRMRKNCGKELEARLVDEYLRQDADIAYAGEDVATSLDKGIDHFKIAPFQHLVYECRPKGSPAEAPAVSTGTRAFLVVPAQPDAVEISTAAMIPRISTAAAVAVPDVSTAPAAPEVPVSTETAP